MTLAAKLEDVRIDAHREGEHDAKVGMVKSCWHESSLWRILRIFAAWIWMKSKKIAEGA